MARESRKESIFYLRSKEATAGTEDDYDFFKTTSCIFDKPATTYLQESDLGKLGNGEFGTQTETQAVATPFSISCSRLSEVAYFIAYCLGKNDGVETIDGTNNVYSHELEHQAITSRVLPTFSAQYVDGSKTWAMNHCIISDFSLTLASGGNGVVDFTANGFCNLHYDSSGTITVNTAGNAWSSGQYNTQVNAEPLINYKGLSAFMSSGLEATPLVHANIDYTAHNLTGSPETLTPYVNSVTVTANNGITQEMLMRAGSQGVLNNQDRGDFAFTLELQVRKDDALPSTTWDAIALADTQKAIELQWLGKIIGSSSERYGMKMFFPVVQITNVTEDDQSPINQTLSTVVHQDSDDLAFATYVQSAFDCMYNGTHSDAPYVSSSSSSST